MRASQGAFIAGSALNIILGFSGLWGIASRYANWAVSDSLSSIYCELLIWTQLFDLCAVRLCVQHEIYSLHLLFIGEALGCAGT